MGESAKRPCFQHIRELDGLRGLAVLLVFLHHDLQSSIHNASRWGLATRILDRLAPYGAYGVDIFFVLSGFLITSLLFDDREKPFYLRNFYWKRVLRIAPLYVITLALLALFLPPSRTYVLLSVLFIVNYANVFHVSPLFGPFWTLAIEEQFYFVWPRLGQKLPVERLQQLALGLFFFVTVFRLLSVRTHHHNFFHTQLRADGLALGAVLACQVFLHRIQAHPASTRAW